MQHKKREETLEEIIQRIAPREEVPNLKEYAKLGRLVPADEDC